MKAVIEGISCEGTPEEIAEIVRLLKDPQTFQVPQVPFIPQFTYICSHDFPQIWHGVIPPVCSKCGLQAQSSSLTFTV
jgi:hypothetical protein